MIDLKASIGNDVKFWHEHLSNIGKCRIGPECVIHSHVWIGDNVIIGSRCRIQGFTFIPEGVVIRNDVFIGPRVTFTNDKHPPGDKESWKATMVEDHVSIGAGAVILPGVILGTGCKIGAGAVVTKSVPAGETWVGNPAAPLRQKPALDRRFDPTISPTADKWP